MTILDLFCISFRSIWYCAEVFSPTCQKYHVSFLLLKEDVQKNSYFESHKCSTEFTYGNWATLYGTIKDLKFGYYPLYFIDLDIVGIKSHFCTMRHIRIWIFNPFIHYVISNIYIYIYIYIPWTKHSLIIEWNYPLVWRRLE